MTIKDTITLSWKNIRSNKLRTGLTVAIIALGICALIWFLTALKAASYSLNSTFSTMGANAFSIRFKERRFMGNESSGDRAKAEKKSSLKEKKSNIGKVITYEQAKQFKEQYPFPAKVSLAIRGGGSMVVNTDRKKTNPDINVLGGDENYLELNGYTINAGRNFTPTEIETGRNICMLGSAVAAKLFPDNPIKALDKVVKVDHIPYRVIAVLNDKGSSSFFNTGKIVLTSYNNIRRLFANNTASFSIGVMVTDNKQMNVAVGEAKGAFRPIRKLDIKEEDNFFIDKSDSIAQTLENNLGFLEKGIIGVALITLLASSIGLMNIMLVAVTERTKEIGLIKALGGTSQDIRNQFIAESIIISLLGAFWGIVIGIILGNVIGLLLKSGLVLLWGWIFGGIIVCTLVGLAAGLYPALKASKLDPIVALRYE
ncbi:MAG: ABC transporter permease [Ferruginibacter sp.]|nr:ABC transporter permease [Ferruginibacter sp.]